MNEQLVTFETAKLAKDKGFDFIDVHSYYHINEGYSIGYALCISEVNEQTDGCLLAPTQSLLQKWLREKHNIHTILEEGIKSLRNDTIIYDIIIKQLPIIKCSKIKLIIGKSYEEALEIGLQEALKLI